MHHNSHITPQHRPRAPLALIAAAVLAACLLLGGLAFVFWRSRADQPDGAG